MQQRKLWLFLRRHVPIFQWLPAYGAGELRGDVFAGLTVGIMLIPQGMAYALLAGMPPIYGLYAALLPMLIYAVFGSSRQLSVGPVAVMSLLVAESVGQLAGEGTGEYLTYAFTLALLVGVIQIIFGLFRLGFLVNFLSRPVISGFSSAAAVIIGASQLKHVLGLSVPRFAFVGDTLEALWGQLPQVNITTLLIGAIGLLVILILRKKTGLFPVPLVVVVAGILAVWLLNLDFRGVAVVGEVPSGLPALSLPYFDWITLRRLFPMALTIAAVGFIQSIAIAKKMRERHRNYYLKPNQELFSLGAANVLGAFFSAFPVTGGFARSVVNDQAGAKTPLAGVIAAGVVALTLLFLTPLFYYLPNAVLAAIILGAVIKLFDVATAVHLWRTDRRDFILLLATFFSTLFLGIEEGILVGVALSVAMMVFFSTRPHVAELGRIPGTTHYRNVRRFDDLEERPEVLIVRFDSQLYFANVEFFQQHLDMLIARKGKALRLIVLNFYAVTSVDSTAVDALQERYQALQKRGIQLYFAGVTGPVRDAFKRWEFLKATTRPVFFVSIADALDYYDTQQLPSDGAYALQAN